MDATQNITILPEDKVQLTNDQKNLIELAFAKQVPPEDAKVMENIQKNRDSNDNLDAFSQISNYYIEKYGSQFGIIYLSAIMGGEEKYQESVNSIEKMNALQRTQRQTQN